LQGNQVNKALQPYQLPTLVTPSLAILCFKLKITKVFALHLFSGEISSVALNSSNRTGFY